MFANLQTDILLAENRNDEAVKTAEKAMKHLPLSRAMVYQYVDALIADHQEEPAAAFLREQVVLYRQDAKLQNQLASVYALQGKQALQHIALAQAYAINGEWQSAMQQLDIARTEKDAQYYELSVIDAYSREWKDSYKEELAEQKKKR